MKRTSTTLLALVLGPALSAQTGSAPPPSNSQVIQLSPFTVDSTRDVGYQAENTLSGSRLNTSLRDTPGSISVFTTEFLDDMGVTDMRDFLDYTVNSELYTESDSGGIGQNQYISAVSLTPRVSTRGIIGSQGIDYFLSITPNDPYRFGRYEDNRGPNGILFGFGAPGGLLNATSKVATTLRDSGSLRYTVGSWDRHRFEMNGNKVLWKDRLAVSGAAVREDSGGWRAFDSRDIRRAFGSIKFRAHEKLEIAVMGEIGKDKTAIVRTLTDTESVLAWYDNREALGVSAVTLTPNNANPNAGQQALGITTRNGNRSGNNRRAIFIENDGTLFDAIGTYLTGTYNDPSVRAPDGTPGTSGSILRINAPDIYPYRLNAGGPGMHRIQSLHNYTLSADWNPIENLHINLAHNYQETKATAYLMMGAAPVLRGEANRTLGVGGPANPYVGQLYFDGEWRKDTHWGDIKETRISAAYDLEPGLKWLGRHRVAAMASRSDQFDERTLAVLALAGRPFHNVPANVNNMILVRNYLTEGDFGTYRVGDWRSLPGQVVFHGQTYDTTFVPINNLANNSGGLQKTDAYSAVLQSRFFDDRLVTTFGYREDRAEITQLGYYEDPILGDVVDRDPANGKLTSLTGMSKTAGAVFHVTDWVSLVANRSSNVGIPSLTRTVFPDGRLPGLSEGEGEDFGLDFNLLKGRLNAKIVYFATEERNRNNTNPFNAVVGRNSRVMDALEAVLVGPGRGLSAAEWEPIRQQYTPNVNSGGSDFESSGYEMRVTANVTRNWRFVMNYSYTDAIRTNYGHELATWYGLKPGEDGVRFQTGVTRDATGQFIVDSNAFESGGAVAKWLELAATHPDANPSILQTNANGLTLGEEISNLVTGLNDAKEQVEKRWGLRPHKISLFTAYDFREGILKNFTVGGGWRWRSPNIVGEDSAGNEIQGRVITGADLLLRYQRQIGSLPGVFRFQLNVVNLFNRTDIIPIRLSTSEEAPDSFILPGGRGVAYTRFDVVEPREIRFTTTYSF